MAVTGSLNGPADRIQITLLSEHNTDDMFEIDYSGKTKIIPIAESQTIQPTIHRSKKKKIKEITTAIPSPQSNQYQFYDKIKVDLL